jgi:hypothetical protein
MNVVNFQASVNNVTQMDRFQQDSSRTPVINQSQNAVIAQEEAEKRIRMPMQPDHAEGKKVDLQRQKNETRGNKKRKQKKDNGSDAKPRQGITTTGGYFVDIQA